MIVLSEITTTLTLANTSYLELIKQYIIHSRLSNDVGDIFAKLNVLKSCRRSLEAYDLATPQIEEPAFNHIKDIVYGVYAELFTLGHTSTLSASEIDGNITNLDNKAIDWLYHSFQAAVDGQTSFTGLPFIITNVDPEALRFVVNGEAMIYGAMADYHIVDSTLIWHNSFLELDARDHLTIAYYLTNT